MRSDDPWSWVDWNDETQVKWLEDKLNAHSPGFRQNFYQILSLSELLSAWLNENTWRLSEVAKWKEAWRKKRSRALNPSIKQVNVRLESSQVGQLRQLERDRRANKTQVIRQLIGDAAKELKGEKAKNRIKRKKYDENLRALKRENNDRIRVYIGIIRDLYQELDTLLPDACRAEILRQAEGDDPQVSETAVRELGREKVESIRSRLPDIRLARFPKYNGPLLWEDQGHS